MRALDSIEVSEPRLNSQRSSSELTSRGCVKLLKERRDLICNSSTRCAPAASDLLVVTAGHDCEQDVPLGLGQGLNISPSLEICMKADDRNPMARGKASVTKDETMPE